MLDRHCAEIHSVYLHHPGIAESVLALPGMAKVGILLRSDQIFRRLLMEVFLAVGQRI